MKYQLDNIRKKRLKYVFLWGHSERGEYHGSKSYDKIWGIGISASDEK